MTYPETRQYVAAISLIIAVLDTAWLDRWQRGKLKTSAKISEQFDCELLEMPWNKLVAGQRPDPEVIVRAARKWKRGD